MSGTWEFLDWFVAAWLRWMVAMSWQIAVLIAVVLLISLLARKASPRFRYFLWCLVLIKLCLPPSIAFITGIGNLLPASLVPAIESRIPAPSPTVSDVPASPVEKIAIRPSGDVDVSPAEAATSVTPTRSPSAN